MPLPAVAVSQTPESKFREYLASRPKPQRFTEQQRELVAHVFAKHSHFDAEQLIEELKKAGKTYEPVVYAGAGHGFMRAGEMPDASPENRKARDDAWKRWKELLAK